MNNFFGGIDMSPISIEDKRCLLDLARRVILDHLEKRPAEPLPAATSPEFTEKRGCFVTLHIGPQLRGCIGTIEPIKTLISAVTENAAMSAFQDPRFPPVTLKDMDKVTIEISILTKPVALVFQGAEDLKKQIKPGVHGVILSRGYNRATFLPQVWEQLPKTEDFLGQLCRKASMEMTCWKDNRTSVEVYEVTAFSETGMGMDDHPSHR
jgi:AmmeMemoRadiSam system protein A